MALMRGGFRVLAEAGSRNAAVSAVVRERPDLCLLSISMPGGGIEAAATLTAVAPSTAVVMLSVSECHEEILASLRAGAVGILPRDMRPERLSATLHGVLRGEPALPRALVGRVLHELRPHAAASALPAQALPAQTDPARSHLANTVALTRREADVMRMLGAGLRTAEIGASLTLSPTTVRRHISSVVAKLGASGREEALRALERARR
jgi:DNA-binding NarL/FixJ family response regulator